MPIILNGTTGITTPGITNTGPFTFQGVVELPAGAVGAPSLTTTGDTNTGIYFPAADTIAFTEGGVEAARFNSSGDFGVGETSPDSRLEVAKAITFTNIDTFPQLCIKPATGSAGNRLNLAVDNSSNVAFIQAVNRGVGDIPLVLQRYAGNVGIGTSSPDTKLTVSVANDAIAARFRSTSGVFRILPFETGLGVKVTALNGAESAFEALAYQAADHRFVTGVTERARITSAGDVGIGTTSPGQRLEVAGNIFVNTSGNPYMEVKTSGAGNNPYLRLTADTNNWTIQGTFSNANDELFFMNNSNTRMAITAGGDVGIGTTSPATKLDVRGIVYTDNQYRVGTNSAGANTGIIKWNAGNSLGIYTWGDALNIEIGGSNVIFKPEGGSERARITSGGDLCIGTTSSAGYRLAISNTGSTNGITINTVQNTPGAGQSIYIGSTTGATNYAITFGVSDTNNYTYLMSFRENVGPAGTMRFYSYQTLNGYYNTSGNWFKGDNTTTWSTTSDLRVKENVIGLSDGLAVITALNPVKFSYRKNKKQDVGFIAQEYGKVLPEQVYEVTPVEDDQPYLNGDNIKVISQNLVPYLVKAIQELKAELDALKGLN